MDGRTEDQLFLRYRNQGDVEALTHVFDRFAPKLLLLAMHIVRDPHLAEDLVQTTFLVAIQEAASYREGTPLLRWLARILSNRAKAERRAARRRQDVPEQLGRATVGPLANLANDPLQATTEHEILEHITRAVDNLTEPYRSVILLRLVHGLQPTEIGHTLGRAPGTVRMQLQRGLQMLRRGLPKSLVVPAAVAWSAWPDGPDGALFPPTADGAAMTDLVVADGSNSSTTARSSERRQLLPGEGAAKPEEAGGPSPAAAYDVRILVVDPKGDPVANASVRLFEPARRTNKRGESVVGETRAPMSPFHTDLTDTTGRCLLHVDRQVCYLQASKDSIGTTGDLLVDKGMRELRSEWRLILHRTVRVTGVVLQADGTAAAGATVRCRINGLSKWRNWSPPPPTTADRQGHFVFRVIPGAAYVFSANLGKRYTKSAIADLETRKARDHDITLRFAGAYSVRGLLLDDSGRPIGGGRIYVQPVPPGKGLRESRSGGITKTSAEGRFEVLLTDGGGYYVAGGAKGWTADCRQVELDGARPHQEVALQLEPYVVVSGRVVDERGQPCAGVFIGLSWTAKQSKRRELISHLHGVLPRGHSAADGSFRFMVPAGLRYRIGCRPLADKPRFRTSKQEVSPPVEGVVVVLTKADREGLTIFGSVVEAVTGAPITSFIVSRLTSTSPGHSSRGVLARCESAKGQFEIGPINAGGHRYSLLVDAPGFAQARLGPFDPEVRRQEVRVAMQKPGTVRCIVKRHDGTVMPMARVWLEHYGGHSFEPFHAASTDANGVALLKGVDPDRYRVSAQRQGDERPGRVQQDIQVRPSQVTRVTLTLHK